MDELLVIKELRSLQPLVSDTALKTSVTLLAVFGLNGSEVIFATKEDNVYCFGRNRFGCLGFGHDVEREIPRPVLNRHLSGKRLKNLYYGFSHYMALTSLGHCFTWGQNDFGQLGIGSFEANYEPQLITSMTDTEVVDMSCGNRHTMALTSDGELYAWGRNTFGQLGDRTWCWRQYPTRVVIAEPIVSISCGKNHSLALTDAGLVYLWGLNDFGQLGRHRDLTVRHFGDGRPKERAFNECPELIPGFERKTFQKAFCGPNHTLLLSTEGHVYAFGLNDFGQIGNGCLDTQYTPTKIYGHTVFKDILTNYESTVSIAVSIYNRHYVWGHYYHQQKMSSPTDVTKWTASYTLHDLYARYSGIKKTYKAIVFSDFSDSTDDGNTCEASDEQICDNGMALEDASDSSSYYSCWATETHEAVPGLVFQSYLVEAFDNQSDFDLVFVFKEEVIYCHKTILEIRNKRFYKSIEKYVKNDNEVYIGEQYSYETMFSFIQYLYSMTPEVNLHNCNQLLELSHTYSEYGLQNLCSQCLQSMIDLDNICIIYETAINYELNSLEEFCVNFAAKHWKTICISEAFQAMDEQISQQFLSSIVKN